MRNYQFKPLKKTFVWITTLLFSILAFMPNLALSAQLTPQNIVYAVKRVEEYIQKNIDSKAIPGCAIAIVYRNHIIYMNSYGVKTIGRPDKIDLDTVFQLGSVSKPIAATLASVLEQKGLINLDYPVNRYLPNFSLKGLNDPSSVKVKNILSHTTGVPRSGFNGLIESFEPYTKIVHALQTTKVTSKVGKKYDYNNAMYGLIGDITQEATNKSFSEALAANLLRPLNMNHTSATLEDLMSTNNRATPHVRVHGNLFPATPYSSGYYAVAPAGGINSSIRDMATFLNAQMGGYPQIVSQQALSRIQTPYVSTKPKIRSTSKDANPKNAAYGLGWRTLDFADNKLVYHSGWVKGFTNFIGFMPDQQIGIVVLHNSESKFSAGAAVKFFELALGLTEGVDIPKKGGKKSEHRKKAKVKHKKKPAKR